MYAFMIAPWLALSPKMSILLHVAYDGPDDDHPHAVMPDKILRKT